MRVTLAQLAAFLWTARLGSVRAAARQLNLSQPTVSLRLRDLQLALGRVLFEREGRGLRLGPDGAALLEHATRILGEVALLEERLGGQGQVAGRVRIGMQETFAMVCLPPLLRDLSETYPALRPELVIDTSADLQAALLAGAIDIAFVSNPTPDLRLTIVPLGFQEAVWAAAPSLALPAEVCPQDLQPRPIIATPPGSPMHRQIIDWFASAGIEPAQLGVCSSVSVIAHLVAAGVAVGLLPRRMIAADVAAGRLAVLASVPPLAAPRVAALYRTETRADALAAPMAILKRVITVLEAVDYLLPTARDSTEEP
ncbi:LysR family transcriptional regulator [Elioraea rosea]|uniref:LysR family transcriptional regulator n=1 Tax=Elioraea rosea TaxID=2492390 RepID=UPI0011844459|nr:LysR family transcriptional regulator [Elioraea rosea]